MNGLQTPEELPERGARHPLLLYQRWNEQVIWPCILIMLICALLLVWAPDRLPGQRLKLAVALVGSGAILVLTYAYRLTAYVQCWTDGLRIQVPFYQMTIPYEAIRTTRPTDFFRLFPPRRVPRLQRNYLWLIMGSTVIVLDLDELPYPRSWLRLRLGRYMLHPNAPGVLVTVPDWIAFRGELDERRTQHRYHFQT